MLKESRKVGGLLQACVVLLPAVTGAFGAEARNPKVQVTALADVEALRPGQSFQLALAFDIEDDWHVYWRSPGDSGLPPSVEWTLPEGLEVGPMRFPVPRRHEAPGGLVTNVHEGQVYFLFSAQASEDLKPGQKLEVTGKVAYLVCKEICVRQQKDVKLTLAVAEESKPANQDVFRQANGRLPIPADQAKHLELSVKPNVDRVRPGDQFKLALVLDIAEAHHISAADAQQVPLRVFLDRPEPIETGPIKFPKSQVKQVPNLGPMRGYTGRVIIEIPYKALDYLAGESLPLGGLLTYQACDDKKGVCFPPMTVEWSAELPIGDKAAAVTPINSPVFGSADPAAGPGKTSEDASDQPAPAGFSLEGDLKLAQRKAQSLWVMIPLAVLAGLILNVTPCVLPVVSIKVLSFVQQSAEDPARVLRLGLVFAAGMMVVFEILAAMAAFAGLAWGQHFQKPEFVVGTTAVIFAFALSMFGVYTLGVPQAVGDLSVRAEREGYLGAFGKGALATVLGTPCLGPFLGGVLVYALSQPASIIFIIFNAVGLGMAVPYVVLTSQPALLRFVPKPGPWMETFKQFMGFVLMATVVYMLYILVGVAGGKGVVWTLLFLLFVAMACWAIGQFIQAGASPSRRAAVWGSAILTCWVGGYLAFGVGFDLRRDHAVVSTVSKSSGRPADGTRLDWVNFSVEELARLTRAGKTVLVDFTADWCPNCKSNLVLALNTSATRAKLKELDAVAMLADWTAENEEIRRTIRKLGGVSIPLLAIFPGHRPNEPIVLDGLVTQSQVLEKLELAGPSRDSEGRMAARQADAD